MRLDEHEKRALKYALQEFDGNVYIFGSRINDKKKGGDIDLLLIPQGETNQLKLSLTVQARFFSKCEQKLDVVVYEETNLFCREIIKSAQRIDIRRI